MAIKKQKKPRKTAQNLHKILVGVLIVVIIIASYFVFTIVYEDMHKSDPQANTEVEMTIVEEPEKKWWNLSWMYSRQLEVINENYEAFSAAAIVSLIFDHQALVQEKKAEVSGSDIRIVFQNNTNELKIIPFTFSNANTTETNIKFALEEDLPRRTSIRNYFVYYGNSQAQENEYLTDTHKQSPGVNVRHELMDEQNRVFDYAFNRKWVLKGEEVKENFNNLSFTLDFNPEFEPVGNVVAWEIDNTDIQGSTEIQDVKHRETILSKDLEVGTHTIKVTYDNLQITHTFNVSNPLYITWTMDWEGYDVKEEYLRNMDTIADTNGMPITHYFNPRIFITPGIAEQRRQYLVDWVKDRKTKRGDEISMHLHMHYDFIQAAGVDIREEVSWSPSEDGYTVLTASYPPEEFKKIVQFGLTKFKHYNLPEPVGYRAGGWFINLDNLKVLPALGFKYDSSGREAYRFGRNNVEGYWNLNTKTPPYKISSNNQNVKTPPDIGLWEFPNNGRDSTNQTEVEMLESFKDNFNGKPITDKQVITYLSHPHWFHRDKPRLEKLFVELNKHKAEDDTGPLVYTTLEKSYEYWNNY